MAMLLQGLPPIHLLETFEVAARRLSFKEAAKELHLTPSAVSQQIKALEQALGLTLFERKPRAVSLTEAGAFYGDVARETLSVFRRGTLRLHERYALRTLRLSADSAVAIELLIPGLSAFHAHDPDCDLRIETSSLLMDPSRDAMDAAVRFGRAPWPGLCADELAPMEVTAVAAPRLLTKQPLRCPADLTDHTLIDVAGAPDYWSMLAGNLGFRVGRRVAFDSYLATLQAAAHGVGVALGVFPMSTAWIADGRLCAPLSTRVPGSAYHLVYRPEDRGRPELHHLRTWLKECFAALVPLAATPTSEAPPKARRRR